MRGICNEAALRIRHPFDGGQHIIEGSRQFAHFIAWAAIADATAKPGGMRVNGNGPRNTGYFRDGLQAASGHEPAADGGKDGGDDDADDEQATECAERTVDIIYCLRDHDGS